MYNEAVMANFLKKIHELGKDIDFMKYQFSDMMGNLREVTLTVDQIPDKGWTSVDGSSVFGNIIPATESYMLLVPDGKTLARIPWEKNCARVICNVYTPPEKEGKRAKAFHGCPRNVLSKVRKGMDTTLKALLKARFDDTKVDKLHAHFAPELEFILIDGDYDFSTLHLDQSLANSSYFLPPSRKVDEVLQEMTLYFKEMGWKREKYHTEVTGGNKVLQCEIGMGHGNVVSIADATMTMRYIIKNVAELHGMRASFIPKFREGVNGNGMHVHQSLAATVYGKEHNLFFDREKGDGLSDLGRMYIAGMLKHAREITAITNALPISYKRLVPGCEAPTYVAWDWENRTALCRAHAKGTKSVRLEYRAPDPKCNPYLAFAAMLSAGLEGIAKGLELPDPVKRDFYHDNSGVEQLPDNLGQALAEMVGSRMLKRRMGKYAVEKLHSVSSTIWKEYCQTVSDHDIRWFL